MWIDIYPKKICKGSISKQTNKKKMLTSLAIRETQIKTTVRYHVTHTRMPIVKKTDNNKGFSELEKLGLSETASGNVKWCSHFGKQSACSSND